MSCFLCWLVHTTLFFDTTVCQSVDSCVSLSHDGPDVLITADLVKGVQLNKVQCEANHSQYIYNVSVDLTLKLTIKSTVRSVGATGCRLLQVHSNDSVLTLFFCFSPLSHTHMDSHFQLSTCTRCTTSKMADLTSAISHSSKQLPKRL